MNAFAFKCEAEKRNARTQPEYYESVPIKYAKTARSIQHEYFKQNKQMKYKLKYIPSK